MFFHNSFENTVPCYITEGDNIDEVIANLKDAIQGWLEVANESQKPDSISKVNEYYYFIERGK